jgi:hypothetical protein
MHKQLSLGTIDEPGALAHQPSPAAASRAAVPKARVVVHIYDRGTFQFKGVDMPIPAVSVLPALLDEREARFPSTPLSAKSKLVSCLALSVGRPCPGGPLS